MPTLREFLIELTVMVGIGAALAALGPFGSFELGSFGARLAYWVPAALIGYAIFRPSITVAQLISRQLDLPGFGAEAVGSLVAAIPATFAIAFFGGFRVSRETSFESLFQLYVNVALIGVMVVGIFALLRRREETVTALKPVTPAETGLMPARAPFLDRLPPAWTDRLVALEMEDHYVRAHGPDASALILLRMRDAEAELAGVDGLRVHRSWWVTRCAVEKVQRDGRSYKLRLSNGLEPPVARDRVAVLRAAGWID